MAAVFGEVSPFTKRTLISDFLTASKIQLGKDFDVKASLRIMKENWVENVHDIRLLSRENELNTLHLPDELFRWIELQCDKKFSDDEEKEAIRDIMEFIYTSALNENGIIYHLATAGGSQGWQNPANQKLILVTSSTIMGDSKPASAILGRDVVRCVTKPIENSWFQIEFAKHRVKPNYYMLRHYSSWDTEALRCWKFEGSKDGRAWTILREHNNDAGLNEKGAGCAWDLANCDEFYSMFRIWQTSANSNRHHYLSLSGFELWGSLEGIDEPRAKSPKSEKIFRYQFDFDTNGILYFIGTKKGTQKWINPGVHGLIDVTSSSISNEVEATAVVGRTTTRCVSQPHQDSWFLIDLKDRRVNPTHYTLRHYASFDTEALRNWHFQASNDGHTWVILQTHKKDDGLKYRGATKTWSVPAQKHAYSRFRIFQYGLNSNSHWYLALSGFEIYGTLYEADDVNDVNVLAEAMGDRLSMDNVVQCRYMTDFDTNGACYYIGSHGNTKPWKNPASMKLIEISASSRMADSTPLSAVVGRETVRCVTKPEKNSWMVVDFKQYSIKPTHYTIRHYSSWDTEALRNWRLEGSNDGIKWTLLKEHLNDTNLDKKGSAHTWEIKRTEEFFSQYRMFLTDVNSNNHYYLACSGFEMYGVLKLPGGQRSSGVVGRALGGAAAPPPLIPAVGPLGGKKAPSFKHMSDFDENGVCYYLGTQMGSKVNWENPMKLGYVNVTSSGLMGDSADVSSIVGREIVRCVTKPTQGAWITMHFRTHFVRPTAYTLRHYSSWHTEALRNWALQGSNDNLAWETLIDHQNDCSLNQKGAGHTWLIPNCTKYYSHFRLAQTGVNSNNHLYMAISGFEIYGGLVQVHPDLHFDAALPNKSEHLVVEEKGAVVSNSGSHDAWQSCRTVESFDQAKGDIQHYDVLVINCPKSSNAWLFILGFVPTEFKCAGAKQWLGSQNSWGYIAGTGGICFNVGKSSNYGNAWGESGNLVGCTCDFAKGTIEFFLDGVSQGIAFTNFRPKDGRAHPAVSLTAANARLMLVKRIDEPNDGAVPPPFPLLHALPVPQKHVQMWDSAKTSAHMALNNRDATAYNRGSNDTWQIALSNKEFSAGRCQFEVELVNDVATSNTWRFIVGVTPAKFNCEASCWLGSQDSWGYIAGTGGKCHKLGKSEEYGAKFAGGDRVGVVMDFPKKTVEFFKNGVSQGISYHDLVGPVRAAISVTGTDASARLRDSDGRY